MSITSFSKSNRNKYAQSTDLTMREKLNTKHFILQSVEEATLIYLIY